MNRVELFYFETAVAGSLARLCRIDLAERASNLAVEWSGDALIIAFFGRPYRVSPRGVTHSGGDAVAPAVASLLLDYVLHTARTAAVNDRWVTFREIKGAGPLMGHFAGNTNKLIENGFAGNSTGLAAACQGLGGQRITGVPGVDLCMEMAALPGIPVRIAFNDRDTELPAQCCLLFRQSVQIRLSLRSIGVVGTWLAGQLIACADR